MANFTAYQQYDTNNIHEVVDPLSRSLVNGGARVSDPTGAYVDILGPGIGIAANGELAGTPSEITQYDSHGNAYYGFSNLDVNINVDYYDTGYTVDGRTMFGFQAETAYWLHGNDYLTGSNSADALAGFAGNDVIRGLGGNDQIYGYNGKDTAVYSGTLANSSVQASGSDISVRSASEGTDSLHNVELVQFADQTLSIAQIAAQQDPNAVFRFYNSGTGTHFYTGSAAEADSVIRNLDSFSYEGVSFDKNDSGSGNAIDVFRFYNSATQTHFYTGSQAEANAVMANLPTFNFEGIAYQGHSTKSEGTTELYRFYNTETQTHFYTANQAEMQSVQVNLAGVYNYEGVAYYVDVA